MLRPDEPCLLKILKDSGYRVWWGGKNDLVPGQNGYDKYCDVKYAPPEPLEPSLHKAGERGTPAENPDYYSMFLGKLHPSTPASQRHGLYYDDDWSYVLGAIEQIRNAPPDQPLCIFLALRYPHPPYAVEDEYLRRIDPALLPPRAPTPPGWAGKPSLLRGIHARQNLSHWDEARWTDLRSTYYAMCARVDAQFGMVMQALKDAGIYDDTAVYFFSDHGDFTGDYGLVEKTQNTFEDCLTRVPFLIKPPAGSACRSRISEALTELVDLPATVLDYCQVPLPYTQFGVSLRPVIAGATDIHRDAVFCEGGRLDAEMHASEGQSGIQDRPQSLYWPRVGLQQRMPEHTKATMCRTQRYKYVRRLEEQDELYDLQDDPQELHNRIDDPVLGGVLLQLKERMLNWYQQTCDVVPLDADRRW